jgi:hypothetical protein
MLKRTHHVTTLIYCFSLFLEEICICLWVQVLKFAGFRNWKKESKGVLS